MADKRIRKEYILMKNNPPASCSASLIEDDMFHWQAFMVGPDSSLYSGGRFVLDISFPSDYPYKPPKVTFSTKIYHPNINSAGLIKLYMLDYGWAPGLTIPTVLYAISSLLADPNTDDPLVPEIAALLKEDHQSFENVAREWTQKHAI